MELCINFPIRHLGVGAQGMTLREHILKPFFLVAAARHLAIDWYPSVVPT
jgi:hypothetical protein